MKETTFLAIMAMSLVAIFYVNIFGLEMAFSEGSRVGVVKKLSQKGFLCKTWEGDLIEGAGDMTQAQPFKFTVKSDSVAAKIHESMKSGKRVELVYEDVMLASRCSGDTSHRILEVKELQ